MSITQTAVSPAYVAGDWLYGAAEPIDVRDPADWDVVVGRVPALDRTAIAAAVGSAARGQAAWGAVDAIARGAVLFRAAALLRERAAEIADLLSRENGKTAAEAAGEVGKSAEFFEFYAGLARMPYGELLHDVRARTRTSVIREPVGVVAAITPWNDPLLTPCRKIAPALACGNAVILKPSSDTPLIALELTRVLLEAGLPAEAINTVTGRGADVVEELLATDVVRAVTFTGSTEVGLGLQRALAGRNLRVQTEMGGKNAAVVLADADLDLAADTVAAAAFGQAGQRCTATSRLLVQSGVKRELVDRLCRRVAALRLGPGSEETSTVGPLVNRRHREDVLGFIDRAVRQGATVLTGGTGDSDGDGGRLVGGCFVRPTILDSVSTEMEIWRDEVFGPVLPVVEVASLEEAMAIVNRSPYGLSASLFTRSLADAEDFLAGVDCGQLAVNLPTSGWDVHHPFGGFKLSGSPFKEQGLEAIGFYTKVKTAAVHTGAA